MKSVNRPALLAGQWYPDNVEGIDGYLTEAATFDDAVAALCPHAGWSYSGRVAGSVYARVPKADVFVLVGVNHRGVGQPVSVYASGAWETPAGALSVDETFAEKLLKACPLVSADLMAHREEHSLEVQMPFLARRFPAARVAPIVMHDYSPVTCRKLGEAIETVATAEKRRVFLIASSDLSHVGADYGQPAPKGESAGAFARSQDQHALKAILALDADGLLAVVRERNVTMCGSGPVAAVIHAARRLGARRAEQTGYATSADVTGDKNIAVGYAGALFVK